MFPVFLLFLVMAIGLSWIIIYLEGHWTLKIAFITLSLYLSLSVFLSVENFKGWATTQNLPDNFEIEWIIVREPYSRNSGGIYLWISDLDFEPKCYRPLLCFSDFGMDGPRSYVIKYTLDEHARAEEMKDQLKSGQRLFGKPSGITGQEEETVLGGINTYDLPDFLNIGKDTQ